MRISDWSSDVCSSDLIARDEPFLLDEQAGDAVGEVAHLAVGPASGIVEDGKRVRVALVDQFDGGVEAVRIVQLREVEEEFGLRFRWRQAVADEGVDMRSRHQTSPPVTAIAWPFTERLSGRQSQSTVFATSSGWMRRPCG